MLQNERKQYILELINRDRIVRAADLVERLGVSMETIRRDLEELEKAGNLRRVYGGAVLGTIYSPEPSYYNREVTHAAQKRAIAAAVYNLIEDEDTLFLVGGTVFCLDIFARFFFVDYMHGSGRERRKEDGEHKILCHVLQLREGQNTVAA